MSRGYTVVQTARLVSALRWAVGRLSDIVGAWAGEAATDAPETAVWMTALSRRLGSHGEAWGEQQPDSELLASHRSPRSSGPAIEAAMDEIAALQGAAARFAVTRQVLIPELVGACAEIRAHAAPHCDAALASAAEMLSHDLSRHREAGDRLSGRLAARGDSVAGAERRLLAAGGIVPRSMSQPA